MVTSNLNPVRNWLKREYAHPEINPDWLSNCCTALLAQEPGLNTKDLIHAVHTQVLLSSLTDSCLPNTGLPSTPEDVDALHGETLFGKDPCLVMILSITEVGHSAFQLQTTMETRKEALSGVARIRRIRNPQADGAEEDDQEEEEDDEKIPPYPRSMLRLELSDGHTTMKAMEYRRINGLTLGETALGSKLVLRGVPLRRGVLMLTPENVTNKGHMVEEIEMYQGRLFQNSLLRAMGKPELPLEDEEPVAIDEENDLQYAGATNGAIVPPTAGPGPQEDHFSEYEGDHEYDLIASGIDLTAPQPIASRPIGNQMNEEMLQDQHGLPDGNELEIMMMQQERAQARAQGPSISKFRRDRTPLPVEIAADEFDDEDDVDWSALEEMDAATVHAGSHKLNNDTGPVQASRLTLGLPFRKPEKAPSVRPSSEADETNNTRSRFFQKPKKSKSEGKGKSKAKAFNTDEELEEEEGDDDGSVDLDAMADADMVFAPEETDEEYVPDDGDGSPVRRKGRLQTRSVRRKIIGARVVEISDDERPFHANLMDLDDEDDQEDSQKENRPIPHHNKGIKGGKRGKHTSDVIEISD